MLVNFYVFDFHPACTVSLCDPYNLDWFDLDTDVTDFGISTDRTFSHKAFADAEQLFFTLLSESGGSVAEAYDVLCDEFQGHKRIAKQAVSIMIPSRRYSAWRAENPQTQPDWDAVREAAVNLGCPKQPN